MLQQLTKRMLSLIRVTQEERAQREKKDCKCVDSIQSDSVCWLLKSVVIVLYLYSLIFENDNAHILNYSCCVLTRRNAIISLESACSRPKGIEDGC